MCAQQIEGERALDGCQCGVLSQPARSSHSDQLWALSDELSSWPVRGKREGGSRFLAVVRSSVKDREQRNVLVWVGPNQVVAV